MLNKLSIEDVPLEGKRVFLRVDFNVPTEKGEVLDDTKIKESLPTIKFALERGARLVLASHLGRPKGKVVEELRMDAVAKRLGELLGTEVRKVDDCVGEEVEQAVNNLCNGEALLLENLRFHKEETECEPTFCRKLASLADMYVNDAFGTVHRAHASISGITEFIEQCVCGFLLKKEIEVLDALLSAPKHPFVAVIGGAKISDKVNVLENMSRIVDKFLFGGAVAYTFFAAEGREVGDSLVDTKSVDLARKLLEEEKRLGVQTFLPIDHVLAKDVEGAEDVIVLDEILPGYKGCDIGPKTRRLFCEQIEGAKTVFWNGPMGIFEKPQFCEGTKEIAEAIARNPYTTVVGGGESSMAAVKFGIKDKITHLSTGGGACLEFLEGKTLPGIAALTDK